MSDAASTGRWSLVNMIRSVSMRGSQPVRSDKSNVPWIQTASQSISFHVLLLAQEKPPLSGGLPIPLLSCARSDRSLCGRLLAHLREELVEVEGAEFEVRRLLDARCLAGRVLG